MFDHSKVKTENTLWNEESRERKEQNNRNHERKSFVKVNALNGLEKYFSKSQFQNNLYIMDLCLELSNLYVVYVFDEIFINIV